MTIGQLWDEVYLPDAEQKKKTATIISEKALYTTWIKKQFGSKRLIDLKTLDYSRLTKKMLDAGKSPRTVHYAFSILLQIWSVAFDNKLVSVQPPRRKTLGLPAIDNERDRAFTLDEAQNFLGAVKKRSLQWHDISLLSLLTGLRASEIFKLRLQDIDLNRGLLFLRSPKKSRSKHLQISDAAQSHLKEMLKNCDDEQEFLVVNRKGEQIKEVSDTPSTEIRFIDFNNSLNGR